MNEPKSLQARADDAIDHATARYNQKLLDERERQRLTTAPVIVAGWRGNELLLQRLGPDQEAGNVNITTGAIGIGDAPAVRGNLIGSTPRVKRALPASGEASLGKIKYLYSVVQDGQKIYYAGGWQKQAVKVDLDVTASTLSGIHIDNLGGIRFAIDYVYPSGTNAVYKRRIGSTETWSCDSAYNAEYISKGFWLTSLGLVRFISSTIFPPFSRYTSASTCLFGGVFQVISIIDEIVATGQTAGELDYTYTNNWQSCALPGLTVSNQVSGNTNYMRLMASVDYFITIASNADATFGIGFHAVYTLGGSDTVDLSTAVAYADGAYTALGSDALALIQELRGSDYFYTLNGKNLAVFKRADLQNPTTDRTIEVKLYDETLQLLSTKREKVFKPSNAANGNMIIGASYHP